MSIVVQNITLVKIPLGLEGTSSLELADAVAIEQEG